MLKEAFDGDDGGFSYNRAPTQELLFVQAVATKHVIRLAKWGFPKVKGSGLIINARAETVDELPTFCRAFEHARIVVPASGYYEWSGGKHPHHFSAGELTLFAGILREDRVILMTTVPNERAAAIHDRMPALLRFDQIDEWLLSEPRHAKAMLGPWPGHLDIREVGPAVGSPKNTGPECLAPKEPPSGQRSLF